MNLTITSATTLHNGTAMPLFGLGVHRAQDGEEVIGAVHSALEAGYRSIDTATLYNNETGVGKAIRESGIRRNDIFLTSKIWNEDQGYQSTFRAFETSLNKLQTDYLDLYLIHWPLQKPGTIETWLAMEELYLHGKIRAIGVSNFLEAHLLDLMAHSKIVPMVNQFEFHPKLQQTGLTNFCRKHHIQTEAWRPIMKGQVNDIPILQELAAKYGKTPVQIVLRWDIQKGVVTIPKSVQTERIRSNANIFDFEISTEDMLLIDALDCGFRLGDDPNNLEQLMIKYGPKRPANN